MLRTVKYPRALATAVAALQRPLAEMTLEEMSAYDAIADWYNAWLGRGSLDDDAVYLNGLLAAGFRLDGFAEPVASPKLARLRPIWTEVPGWLVVRCTKVRSD